MTRTAVVTALAGDYETLKPHPDVDTRWIAFTDSDPAQARAAGWEHKPLMYEASSSRLAAKFYKVNTTAVLSGFDRTLWVDASVELTDGEWVSQQLGDTRALVMFAHPERQCVYDEALASLEMPKYRCEPLLEQVAHYHAQGHPRHWGLWAGGVIARGRTCLVSGLETAWWHEIARWSCQDQLSLPFVLRRKQMRPAEMAGNLYDNPHFRIHFQPGAR